MPTPWVTVGETKMMYVKVLWKIKGTIEVSAIILYQVFFIKQ